jgi:hypothetical protein
MGSVAHKEYSPLLEVLRYELGRLPVRDIDDLDRHVRFPDPVADQPLPTLGGVIVQGFSMGWVIIGQEHSAINISDQKDPADARPSDKDCVGFVASDQLSPVSLEIHKDIVFIELSKSFSFDAERVSDVTVRTVAADQIFRANCGQGSRRTMTCRRRYALLILVEGNQFGVVPNIATTLPSCCQKQRFQPTLRAIPR